MAKFLPLLAFLTSLLLLLKASSALNFNYPNFFSAPRNLIFQGDAVLSSGHLQLTRVDRNGNPLINSIGRVLHSSSLLLINSAGRHVGFTTTFLFRITKPGTASPGDGLTFFIAPPASTIPPGSVGPRLGLFPNNNALNNSRNDVAGFEQSGVNVVAVEFDTHVNLNLGDPNHRHIGVDVNSIRSRVTTPWNWINGEVCTATITYDPLSQQLRVLAGYPNKPRANLSYRINLAANLPATVRVGFSGATGQTTQVNDILSWSFASNLGGSHVAEEDEGGYIASVV